jgi:hypothetical protein
MHQGGHFHWLRKIFFVNAGRHRWVPGDHARRGHILALHIVTKIAKIKLGTFDIFH